MRGGYALTLLHNVRRTIEENPYPFVSPYVHLCLVRRSEITMQNSDYTEFLEGGERYEIQMPPVAHSWQEFVALCDVVGADASAAAG